MTAEVVPYNAADADGRPRRWEGVVRYTCPNGCSTGFYDFRRARPAGQPAGVERRARRQRVAWTVTGVLVAVGLVVMYGLFIYAVAAIPMAPWLRPVLWVATTAAFAAVGALLVLPPRAARLEPTAADASGGDGSTARGSRAASEAAGQVSPPAPASASPEPAGAAVPGGPGAPRPSA
ncbi:MAG TPA: hypothetical protein VIK90_00685 [Limnochordales bacterium]